jgi:hypothetical protein
MDASDVAISTYTAEIRVLTIGTQRLPLTVARQLDHVEPSDIYPFGRVKITTPEKFSSVETVEVIGSADGQLVRSSVSRVKRHHLHGNKYYEYTGTGTESIFNRWSALKLIILSGLR